MSPSSSRDLRSPSLSIQEPTRSTSPLLDRPPESLTSGPDSSTKPDSSAPKQTDSSVTEAENLTKLVSPEEVIRSDIRSPSVIPSTKSVSPAKDNSSPAAEENSKSEKKINRSSSRSPSAEAKPSARKQRSKSRSPSVSKDVRSSKQKKHSPTSPTKKKRSKSKSPSRKKKSKSRSPARKRRSRSKSVTRRKRSRSNSRRKKSKSRSPVRRRRSRSRSRSRKKKSKSPARRKRSKSRSPARKKRSKSRSVTRTKRSRSRSPKRKRSKSRSPARKKRSKSRSPRRSKRSKSRSPARRKRSKSVEKSKRSKSHSPAKRKRSRSRSTARARRSRSRSTSKHRRKSRSSSRGRRSSSRRRQGRSRYRSRSVDRWRRRAPSHSPILILRRRRSKSRTRRSTSKTPPRLTELDKDQLLEIAKANAAAMCAKAGVPIPESLKPKAIPAPLPIEEVKRKVVQKANSISIKELTEKCKQIAESKEDENEIINKPHVSDDEDEERPFGSQALRVGENKGISFSLSNPSAKPVSRTEVALTKEFPVSSGSQHRKKESDGAYGEWVPVDTKQEKDSKDDVFGDTPVQPVDITLAMSERAAAQKKLAENPFDVNAICMLNRAQEQVDAWAQSNTMPGRFTGSTGAQVLSSEELSSSGPQAWVKK
uniref:SON DNA binding protein n=1 Tax=Lepisosteus oculatus TaxID=7918 RepID=W5MYR7_LEPOC